MCLGPNLRNVPLDVEIKGAAVTLFFFEQGSLSVSDILSPFLVASLMRLALLLSIYPAIEYSINVIKLKRKQPCRNMPIA